MKSPDQIFTIFEEYEYGNPSGPLRIYFGRFVGGSQRHVLNEYTLKKREYINTTSMDSELALLTANLSLAGEGKVFYDPFVGTGSFLVACSHFGARTLGSDIDGMSSLTSDLLAWVLSRSPWHACGCFAYYFCIRFERCLLTKSSFRTHGEGEGGQGY